jgi:hypothetical protein
MRRLTAILIASTLTFGAFAPPVEAWTSTQRCRSYEPLMVQHAPKGGWDVRRMSYYSWRESRCQPAIVNRTGRDTGLFQIHPVTWPWLSTKFGVPTWQIQSWLKVPANNVRAAAALCSFWRRAGRSCYQPWAT